MNDYAKTQEAHCGCRMNPLGLPPDRFLIAESESGSLLGFGQLQEQPNQQNGQFLELRTLIVADDARYTVLKSLARSIPVTAAWCISA